MSNEQIAELKSSLQNLLQDCETLSKEAKQNKMNIYSSITQEEREAHSYPKELYIHDAEEYVYYSCAKGIGEAIKGLETLLNKEQEIAHNIESHMKFIKP